MWFRCVREELASDQRFDGVDGGVTTTRKRLSVLRWRLSWQRASQVWNPREKTPWRYK
jgi:hypothetical protein